MRPHGKMKMGYYAPPITIVEMIKSFLNFPEDKTISIFDPCCGEGIAIEYLSKNINSKTYGIELDEYRADEAKNRLNHIIKGDYKQTRISNNVFSVLYLNPPYDYEEGFRKEYIFLQDNIKYLKPDG